MEKSLSLGVVIGAALSGGFHRTLIGAQTQFSKLGATIKDLSGQRGLIERFEQDEAELEKARLALGKTQKQVMALKLALRKNPGDGDIAKALEKTRAKAEKLSTSLERQKEKLRQSREAMGKAGIEVKDYAHTYTKLGLELEKTREKHARLEKAMAAKNRAGQRLGELKGQMLGLAGAVYGAGRLIGQAAEFEGAEVRLGTVLNTDNLERDLGRAKKFAVDYARKGLSSETEILDIQYALNSAGLEASAARLGSSIVAKVAKVTNGAAEGVGEVVATVFNNLGGSLEGETEDRLKRIGDLLTKTQFKFQIRDFGQLGESMKYATPAMVGYNMELSQGLTLIGALNSAGLQGSQAGTALAASFRKLSAAADEFGFQIERDANGSLDFIATMENLSEAIGGFEQLDQETIDRLQKAFGEEGIRAVTLLGTKLGDLRAAQKDVAESSKGLVDKSYQRFLDSTSGQITLLTNNTRILGTTFAGTLLPSVNAVMKPLTSVATWTGAMIERFPVIGRVIGAVAVGVGAFTAGLGVVTAATWLWNAALLANPIGLTVAAVVGGAALIITAWEPIAGFFGEIWDGITSIFSSGVHLLGKIWSYSPLGLLFKAGEKLVGLVGKFAGPATATAVTAAMAIAPGPTLAASHAPLPLPDIPPALSRNAPSAAPIHNNQRYEITIHPTPGMNTQDIAEQVRRQLDERDRQAAADRRGALHDG